MAEEEPSEPQCCICRAALGDSEDDPKTSLMCGHTFHSECLNMYCENIQLTLEQLPCPMCKLRACDLMASAEEIQHEQQPPRLRRSGGSDRLEEETIIDDDDEDAGSDYVDDEASLPKASPAKKATTPAKKPSAKKSAPKKASAKKAPGPKPKGPSVVNLLVGPPPTPKAEGVEPSPEEAATPKAEGVAPSPEETASPTAEGVAPSPEAAASPTAEGVAPSPKVPATPKAEGVGEAPSPKAPASPKAEGVAPSPKAPAAPKARGVASSSKAGGVATTPKAAAAPKGSFFRPLEELHPTVFCTTCGSPCSYMKCRILSKRDGTWRCNSCRVRIVQLSRSFDQWPVPGFKHIPTEVSQKFFRDAADSSQEMTKGAMTALLEKHQKHETFYEEGGKFLPLAVWERKGFDPVAIATKSDPSDVLEHPVIGTTYRIRLLTSGTRGSSGWSHSERNSASGKRRKTAPTNINTPGGSSSSVLPAPEQSEEAAEPEEATEPEEAAEEESSDSSSSSDSTSSSGAKKKKKGKKSKKKKTKKKQSRYAEKAKRAAQKAKEKEQKAKEKEKEKQKKEKEKQKQEKAQEKEKDKAEAAKRVFAQQLITKINPIMLSFASVIANPVFSSLSPSIIDSAKNLYGEMELHDKQAREVDQDPSQAFHKNISSLKDITKLLADTKKTQTLIQQLFVAMDRMPTS